MVADHKREAKNKLISKAETRTLDSKAEKGSEKLLNIGQEVEGKQLAKGLTLGSLRSKFLKVKVDFEKKPPKNFKI